MFLYSLNFLFAGSKSFHASSNRFSNAPAKKGVFTHIPTSYVGCTASSCIIINNKSLPSTKQNLAAIFPESLTSATPFRSLTAFWHSFVKGAATLIATPFLASFCSTGFNASTFLTNPLVVVARQEGTVIEVNGDQSIDAIHKEIEAGQTALGL